MVLPVLRICAVESGQRPVLSNVIRIILSRVLLNLDAGLDWRIDLLDIH